MVKKEYIFFFFQILLIFLSTLSLILFLYVNLKNLSLPGYDSENFFPVSYWHLFSSKLEDPFLSSGIQTQFSNTWLRLNNTYQQTTFEYNFHGWLWPIIISYFTLSKNYFDLIFSSSLLVFVTYFLFIFSSIKISDFKTTAFSSPYFAILTLYQSSRPEILSTFFLIFLLILISIKKKKNIHLIFESIIYGLMTVTSPATSFLSIIFLYIKKLQKNNLLIFFKKNVLFQGVLILVIVILSTELVVESGFVSWLNGIFKHGSGTFDLNTISIDNFKHYYILNPKFPTPVILLILIFCFLIKFYSLNNYSILKKSFLNFTILFCLFFLIFNISNIFRIYLLISTSPIIWFWIVKNKLNLNHKINYIILFMSFLFILFSTLYLLKENVNYINTIKKGISSNEMVEKINQELYKTPEKQKIYSNSVHSYLSLHSYAGKFNQLVKNIDEADYIIFLQAGTGLNSPPKFENFKIIINKFHFDKPKFLNITFGRTLKDWSFALYKRM